MKSSASQKMKSNPFHPPQRISSRSDFIPLGISFVFPKGETDLIATFGRRPSSLNYFLPNKGYKAVFDFAFIFGIAVKLGFKELFLVGYTFCDYKWVK